MGSARPLYRGCTPYTVRPGLYMFVKAHLFVCHLCLAIRNMGSLSNTDASLMESHHVMTKADGSMTTIHSGLQQIVAVQQRRYGKLRNHVC